ncbi:MAG: hypothetical protein WC685_02940 [Methylobacter sp.]
MVQYQGWRAGASFISEPLKVARQLVGLLQEKTKIAAIVIKSGSPELNFKFIGPAGSTTLQSMVNELEAASTEIGSDPYQQVKVIQNGDKKNDLIEYLQSHPFEFYDSSASADWPSLTFPSDNKDINLQSYLKKLDLASLLTRTSLTYYQLASAMAKELTLRGFKIDCKKSSTSSHA